ncbi:alpha/beta hydrolase [Fimbriiglobus ruber]|nr:alpha/beta hydrolase-fold protein [Fimbriiglobus ruber]
MLKVRRSVARWVAAVVVALMAAGSAPAAVLDAFTFGTHEQIERLNKHLSGQVLDFTNNHGVDRRLYSPALDSKRDLYVYLPPGYDGCRKFPVMLWLHGLGLDEKNFLYVVPVFDAAIRAGKLPPMVIASPDGSINGKPALASGGSFYLNSKAGNFEDYIMNDIWPFVTRNFAVRPERGAHVLAGVSMGGFGTYNLGFKHPDEFGLLGGIMPPLNMRYADCNGRYFANYDPACVSLRNTDRPGEVIGRFYLVVPIRSRHLLDPLVDSKTADPTAFVARENPIEMLSAYDIKPGRFEMFIGYGKRDEFNIDAQVESFVDEAKRRGIRPTVAVVPDGRHNMDAAVKIFNYMAGWINQRVAPYVPAGYDPTRYPPANTAPAGVLRRKHLFPLGARLPIVGTQTDESYPVPSPGSGDVIILP